MFILTSSPPLGGYKLFGALRGAVGLGCTGSGAVSATECPFGWAIVAEKNTGKTVWENMWGDSMKNTGKTVCGGCRWWVVSTR